MRCLFAKPALLNGRLRRPRGTNERSSVDCESLVAQRYVLRVVHYAPQCDRMFTSTVLTVVGPLSADWDGCSLATR